MYKRAYSGSRFYLEVDGVSAGWLQSADGGQATTEVVQERMAAGYPSQKHPSTVKYEDISISCGTGMSKQFYDWLNGSINYEYQRRDGAIVVADYDFKEVNRLNFYGGLITEIGFPALDATSKEPCRLSAKIATSRTEMKFDRGKSIMPVPSVAAKQKQWMASNFRVTVDGMDCSKVSKVEAITVKQKVIDNPVGEKEAPGKEPIQIDFPNLILTLPEQSADKWYDWHQKFVVKGISDQNTLKQGSVEFLTKDLKTTLFALDFTGLGIIKFTPDKLDSGGDKLRMVKIEMFCEQITFDYKNNSTWA